MDSITEILLENKKYTVRERFEIDREKYSKRENKQ